MDDLLDRYHRYTCAQDRIDVYAHACVAAVCCPKCLTGLVRDREAIGIADIPEWALVMDGGTHLALPDMGQ